MKQYSVLLAAFLACGGLAASAQNRPELVGPRGYQSPKSQAIPGTSFVPAQPKPSPATPSSPVARGSARPSQTSQTPRALQPLRPPRVSYNAGQLSIVAENSTLAEVLNAVRQKTGAVIESPPSAARERVVISIGPAPANDVLTALLNGSRFDYIILGAQHGSGAPQHVILREQQALPAGQQQAQVSTAPMRQLPPEAPEPMEEEEFVPEPEVTEEVQSEPVAEPANDQHGQQQSGQQPEQPQVKTPEQMLEELKRMQQQQLQQQQQPGSQPQGNEQQQQQQNQQPQDQQQQPPEQAPPDNDPPLSNRD